MRAKPRQRPYPRTVALPPLLAELARAPGRGGAPARRRRRARADRRRGPRTRACPRRREPSSPARGALRARRLRDRPHGRRGAGGSSGVDGAHYVGEHGLELAPEAEQWVGAAARTSPDAAEWPAERKRLTVSFHWRTAPDEEEAVAALERVAEQARAEGPRPALGSQGARAASAGPRRTRAPPSRACSPRPEPAARALRRRRHDRPRRVPRPRRPRARRPRRRRLRRGSRRELREAADVVVDGPAEFLELLAAL